MIRQIDRNIEKEREIDNNRQIERERESVTEIIKKTYESLTNIIDRSLIKIICNLSVIKLLVFLEKLGLRSQGSLGALERRGKFTLQFTVYFLTETVDFVMGYFLVAISLGPMFYNSFLVKIMLSRIMLIYILYCSLTMCKKEKKRCIKYYMNKYDNIHHYRI